MTKDFLYHELCKYGDVNIEGNSFYVRHKDAKRYDRRKMLLEIYEKLLLITDDCTLHGDNPRFSRMGYLRIGKFRACVKPHPSQRIFSAGKLNEMFFVEMIQNHLKEHPKCTICIEGHNKKKQMVLRNVISVDFVKSKKRSKADIVVRSKTKDYRFSIKQLDSEKYESADTYYGSKAYEIIQHSIKESRVRLTQVVDGQSKKMFVRGNRSNPVMKLSKQIIIEMTPEEQHAVVFGNDLQNGAVLIQTFTTDHFSPLGAVLTIRCQKMYSPGDSFEENDIPCWFIRNDPARNSKNIGIAGLRVEAVFKSRTVNANAIKFGKA